MNKHLKGFVLVYPKRSILIEPGWHLSYATEDGGPVLKTDTGWRNWNGLMHAGRKRVVWLYFRRRAW